MKRAPDLFLRWASSLSSTMSQISEMSEKRSQRSDQFLRQWAAGTRGWWTAWSTKTGERLTKIAHLAEKASLAAKTCNSRSLTVVGSRAFTAMIQGFASPETLSYLGLAVIPASGLTKSLRDKAAVRQGFVNTFWQIQDESEWFAIVTLREIASRWNPFGSCFRLSRLRSWSRTWSGNQRLLLGLK